jgi:hypothetical protein
MAFYKRTHTLVFCQEKRLLEQYCIPSLTHISYKTVIFIFSNDITIKPRGVFYQERLQTPSIPIFIGQLNTTQRYNFLSDPFPFVTWYLVTVVSKHFRAHTLSPIVGNQVPTDAVSSPKRNNISKTLLRKKHKLVKCFLNSKLQRVNS